MTRTACPFPFVGRQTSNGATANFVISTLRQEYHRPNYDVGRASATRDVISRSRSGTIENVMNRVSDGRSYTTCANKTTVFFP